MTNLPISNMDLRKITSPFGKRIHPITKNISMHNGIDYPCPIGTPIHAFAGGKVVASKMQNGGGGLGNYVTILHPNGTYTLYAHLNQRHVYLGNIVRAGQVIGLSGNTGASTGPHLHFGICKKYVAANVNASAWMDPLAFLEKMEDEVISTKTILFNGEPLDVEMSTVNDTNYIKLRDLEKLNVGLTISYNASKKMPEIKTKK